MDLLCELFGDPNPIELKDLDEPAKKKTRTRAAEFEERALASEGVQDTSGETIVYPTGPLNNSLGVDVNYCPRQEISEFTNHSTGNLVNRTKYYCQMCTYSSFNRDSTYTHTRRHLNVVVLSLVVTKNMMPPMAFLNTLNQDKMANLYPRVLNRRRPKLLLPG